MTGASYGAPRSTVDPAYRIVKRRRLDALQGRPWMVPAGPSAERVSEFTRAGVPYAEIARRIGMPVSSVRGLGLRRKIHRETAELIAACRIDDMMNARADGDRRYASGTRRKLDAMSRCGFSSARIAAAAGITECSIRNLIHNDLSRTSVRNIDAVQRAFDQLAGHWAGVDQRVHPGHAQRVRATAIGRGALPWWAWPDIDDPSCQPIAWHDSQPLQVVDVAWQLAADGFGRQTIVARTGVHWKTVVEYHRRMRRPLPEGV